MKFRKKPVVIEAHKWDGNYASLCDWVKTCSEESYPQTFKLGVKGLKILTLEGEMRCEEGDYIICGVQGEFYPCKPDIFEATYEGVEG